MSDRTQNRGTFYVALGAAALAGALVGCASETTDTEVSNASPELRSRTSAPTLTPQTSGTTSRLQAISPVDSRVVWASGVDGTYAITTDGGRTWQSHVVPGAELLQFRDVEAVSAREAYLLSAGVGTDSRIYKTTDGGNTWTLQFQNEDPNGFYDCFSFWSPRRGVTMGDSVNGRIPALQTRDGRNWVDIGDQLPPALAGEAAFAASGTCVATFGVLRAWIITGAAEKSRVLATRDGGRHWNAYDTPIIQGTASSGGTSIAFRDAFHGIVGGGELAAPDQLSDNFARSRDGGRTWELGAQTPFTGAIYGLAYAVGRAPGHDWRQRADDDMTDEDGSDADVPLGVQAFHDHGHGHDRDVRVVATGPGGASWSRDEGSTWTLLPDTINYWAVAFANERTGWLVGTEGRILRVDF